MITPESLEAFNRLREAQAKLDAAWEQFRKVCRAEKEASDALESFVSERGRHIRKLVSIA
jgi:hypothetical protein